MSVNSLMVMTCIVSRDSDTAASFDDYGNITPTWASVSSTVKCYISGFQPASGKFDIPPTGLNTSNEYYGFFKSTEDIRVGDKVLCSAISSSYLQVKSVVPVVNARNNQTSHKECILELMGT